jgi:glycosyltransferase involved in cell wall biosynthesis
VIPRVSVVIPCYNQGVYIDEAIDSVFTQTFRDYEIIIVNDGSTDRLTLEKLSNFADPRIRVIHTENQGLAAARNNGIRAAEGEFILPLDADDRIGPTYLEKAVNVLDSSPETGIVYCLAELFGDQTGVWALPEYSLGKLLLNNMIFCSALFRKVDWERVGGYRACMKYGWEDWDFWLSLVRLKLKVQRIPESLFYYRVKSKSMNASMSYSQKFVMLLRLFSNHHRLYLENFRTLCAALLSIK